MPHVDFGKAFSSPDDRKSPTAVAISPGTFSKPAPEGFDPQPRRSWLTKSGWSNVSFVSVATFGGLLFAFYLFSDSDFFRAARRWTREFLYAQPQTPEVTRLEVARAIGVEPPRDPARSGDNGGDPFFRANAPLSAFNPPNTGNGRVNANPLVISGGTATSPSLPGIPATPGFPGIPGLPEAGRLLSQLGLPVPGGDHLSRVFNRGVAELQRVTQLVQNHTVVVVETKVTKVEKIARNGSLRGSSTNDRGEGLNAAGQAATQGGQSTAGAANSATNQASNTASNGTNGLSQTASNTGNAVNSSLNSVRGAVSNPGGGLGRIGGAVGGAVGGLGLGGGHGGGGHR